MEVKDIVNTANGLAERLINIHAAVKFLNSDSVSAVGYYLEKINSDVDELERYLSQGSNDTLDRSQDFDETILRKKNDKAPEASRNSIGPTLELFKSMEKLSTSNLAVNAKSIERISYNKSSEKLNGVSVKRQKSETRSSVDLDRKWKEEIQPDELVSMSSSMKSALAMFKELETTGVSTSVIKNKTIKRAASTRISKKYEEDVDYVSMSRLQIEKFRKEVQLLRQPVLSCTAKSDELQELDDKLSAMSVKAGRVKTHKNDSLKRERESLLDEILELLNIIDNK